VFYDNCAIISLRISFFCSIIAHFRCVGVRVIVNNKITHTSYLALLGAIWSMAELLAFLISSLSPWWNTQWFSNMMFMFHWTAVSVTGNGNICVFGS